MKRVIRWISSQTDHEVLHERVESGPARVQTVNKAKKKKKKGRSTYEGALKSLRICQRFDFSRSRYCRCYHLSWKLSWSSRKGCRIEAFSIVLPDFWTPLNICAVQVRYKCICVCIYLQCVIRLDQLKLKKPQPSFTTHAPYRHVDVWCYLHVMKLSDVADIWNRCSAFRSWVRWLSWCSANRCPCVWVCRS